MMKHIIIPVIVGINIERIVHFMLFVSFLIVKIVVPHGKWHIVNIMKDIAVIIVQLFWISIFFNSISEL